MFPNVVLRTRRFPPNGSSKYSNPLIKIFILFAALSLNPVEILKNRFNAGIISNIQYKSNLFILT